MGVVRRDPRAVPRAYLYGGWNAEQKFGRWGIRPRWHVPENGTADGLRAAIVQHQVAGLVRRYKEAEGLSWDEVLGVEDRQRLSQQVGGWDVLHVVQLAWLIDRLPEPLVVSSGWLSKAREQLKACPELIADFEARRIEHAAPDGGIQAPGREGGPGRVQEHAEDALAAFLGAVTGARRADGLVYPRFSAIQTSVRWTSRPAVAGLVSDGVASVQVGLPYGWASQLVHRLGGVTLADGRLVLDASWSPSGEVPESLLVVDLGPSDDEPGWVPTLVRVGV